jgi:hypothetical protein
LGEARKKGFHILVIQKTIFRESKIRKIMPCNARYHCHCVLLEKRSFHDGEAQ